MTKSTTKVAFQPRTLEIEHFLGVKADIVKISSSKPIVHFFDEADPRVWVRSIDMVEQVDPTPAFPIVSIFESFALCTSTDDDASARHPGHAHLGAMGVR